MIFQSKIDQLSSILRYRIDPRWWHNTRLMHRSQGMSPEGAYKSDAHEHCLPWMKNILNHEPMFTSG
jgi:hypothetical protein